MILSELLTGAYARLYTLSCMMVILSLIMVMAVRLFWSRRRKAYFSLTLSVITFIVQHGLLIRTAVSGGHSPEWIDFAAQILSVTAFILISQAIFQLYNSTKRRHHLYFYSSLFATLLLGLFRLNVPRLFEGAEQQMETLKHIGLDLYLLLLIFICFWAIPPSIGQGRKYQFGMFVYFVVHLSYLINTYMLDAPHPALTLTTLYLPLLFYFILFLLLFERIVELMQASYRSSITDGLTGLFNRKYMLNRTAQYLHHGYDVSVLFSDIDNFKQLNDTKGHQAGDEALRAVAQTLLEESEGIGFAGRFGGEEMIVLVVDPSVNIAKFAESVRKRIEAETGVTVSIGYSESREGLTAEQLIDQADQAMYIAKKTGKNKAVKYSPKAVASVK